MGIIESTLRENWSNYYYQDDFENDECYKIDGSQGLTKCDSMLVQLNGIELTIDQLKKEIESHINKYNRS